MNTFKTLQISEKLLQGLNEIGFTDMTPVQNEAIPAILKKQDVMVQSPTGSGKTCAFGIPIVANIEPYNNNVQAIILCPTRELVMQTTDVLRKLTKYMEGIKIASVYGGERIDKQIVVLRRKPMIVVATPGRALDFLDRKVLKLGHIKTVVLDEADRMLDMGFRDDINTILCATPDTRQTVLFSATFSREVARIAKEYQTEAVMIKIAQETETVDSVSQFYVRTKNKLKIPTLVKLLQEKQFSSCLIFAGTKSMTDTIAVKLHEQGYRTAALHGDLRQRQRDFVMNQFRQGSVNILVATDVASRGIDVQNIEAVINFDIPQSSESYVHRIGRTGRAKQAGLAYTFIYPNEINRLNEIIHKTKANIQPVVITSVDQTLNTRMPAKSKEIFNGKTKQPVKDNSTLKSLSTPLSDDARMFISLGTMDKLSKKSIVSLISEKCNVPEKQIGTISLYDSYSFFNIPSSYVDQIRACLHGKSHNKRSITVELSKGTFRHNRNSKKAIGA